MLQYKWWSSRQLPIWTRVWQITTSSGYIADFSVLTLTCLDIRQWARKWKVSNPNLQVVIMHESHVCSKHLFGLPLRMYGMHRTHFDHARLDLLSLVIWSCMFWPSFCHMKLMQSTALEQKHFDLRSLLLALHNLWLLLVSVLSNPWASANFHDFIVSGWGGAVP